MTVAVFLDTNVPLKYCVSNKYANFMEYLEEHPFLGTISEKRLDRTRNLLRKGGLSERDYDQAIQRFLRIPTFIEVTPPYKCDMTLREVNKFFARIASEGRAKCQINPGMVSVRYRDIVSEINSQAPLLGNEKDLVKSKVINQIPGTEDMILIADAVTNHEFDTKYIASADAHFLEPLISQKIEERFGIKCRHPENIVAELKPYEHLFRRKTIV